VPLPEIPFDLDGIAGTLAVKIAERLHLDAERLLDRTELAERLGIGGRTVSSMVAKQQLPPPLICTGGISRWSWQQVQKYLESRQGRQRRGGRGRYSRQTAGGAE
jgi:predicted DNA-binding transcriptional regulator AlpA